MATIWLMGVSGCGKTTVGKILGDLLNLPFVDGDDHHSGEARDKMASGVALTDEDRAGWLQKLNDEAKKHIGGSVIACSALKAVYRAKLNKDVHGSFVLLEGTRECIEGRLNARSGHFMPASLLDSQLATLESPVEVGALVLQVDDCSPHSLALTIKDNMKKKPFGIIGLGVMGKSLARNFARNNMELALFNRVCAGEQGVAEAFLNDFSEELGACCAFDGDLPAFVNACSRPRQILIMVNAPAVQAVLDELMPLLDESDIVIDAGNSNYEDTQRRQHELMAAKKAFFLGVGVSGGELGALHGPSIMVGGDLHGVSRCLAPLRAIAALDTVPESGLPCVIYTGGNSSGHFVKMVHNGIEYAEMQLLAESVALLKASGCDNDEAAAALEAWPCEANSYLLDITVAILRKRNPDDVKGWLLDCVLDVSGNKGTGSWSTIASAKIGAPSTMVSSALFARYVSASKSHRQRFADLIGGCDTGVRAGASQPLLDKTKLCQAVQLARIVNHHQGIVLLDMAAKEYKWNDKLVHTEILRCWSAGCILRSALIVRLSKALTPENPHPLHACADTVRTLRPSLKSVLQASIGLDIPTPCLGEALQFLNGITCADSTATVIQAQRDCFGAHTYKRSDCEGSFHSEWL